MHELKLHTPHAAAYQMQHVTGNQHSQFLIYQQSTECCRRLADALNGGVANVATKHAVEALHHLAVQLPTCRDLILATTALDTLVLLLKQSLANAHYSMLKVMLVCLMLSAWQPHVASPRHLDLGCASLELSNNAVKAKAKIDDAHLVACIQHMCAICLTGTCQLTDLLGMCCPTSQSLHY